MANAETIEVKQGETSLLNFIAKRNGVVFDITSYTINFHVKKQKDGALLIDTTGAIVSGPAGTFTVTLTSTQTNLDYGKYLYETWIVSGSNKYNLGVGEFRVVDTLSIPA